MTHALDDADGLVVNGALGVAHEVGQAVEDLDEHPLEDRAGDVRADAAVDTEAERGVPVARAGEVDAVRVGEDGRVAVGHGPGQPQPVALLELGAGYLAVLRDRPPVPGRWGEVAQELLGCRVEQGVALAAEARPFVGVPGEPLQGVCGEGRGGVEAASDEQGERADEVRVGRGLTVDLQPGERVGEARARVGAYLVERGGDVLDHRHVALDDARHLRGVGRRVDAGVGGLVVQLPLRERNAHHRQGEDGGDDVGEVVHEVDPAALDPLVDRGADHLVDEGDPALDRRRGEVGVQGVAVGALLGRVHLQEAASQPSAAGRRRDADALVAAAFAVDVVVVGKLFTGPGEGEQLPVAGGHPVPAVGVAPAERATVVELPGLLFELVPVRGSMPVEVDAGLLAGLVVRGVPCGHVCFLPVRCGLPVPGRPWRVRRRGACLQHADGSFGAGADGFDRRVLLVGGNLLGRRR